MRSPGFLLLSGATVLLAGSACGFEAGGAAGGAAIRDSAGIRVVSNPAPGGEGLRRWELRGEPVAEVGARLESPAHQFSEVSDGLLLPSGGIAVLDRGSAEIRIYGPRGAFRRALGGRGEGPAELVDPRGLAFVPPDTLLAFDGLRRRVAQFHLEDGYVGAIRLEEAPRDPEHPLRHYFLVDVLPEGKLLLQARSYPATIRSPPQLYWDSTPNLIFDREGRIRDTVGVSGMDTYSSGRQAGPSVFARVTAVTASGKRVFVGHGGSWEVEVHRSDGDLARLVRLEERPRRLTDAVLERWLEERAAGVDEPAARRRMVEYYRDQPRPDRVPAFRRMMADDRGRIWVRRYRLPGRGGSTVWEVFDERGVHLGRVTAERDLKLFDAKGAYVLAYWSDALDVPHVLKYRRPDVGAETPSRRSGGTVPDREIPERTARTFER